MSNALGFNHVQFEEQLQTHNLPYAGTLMRSEQINNANLMPPPQMSQQNMFDSPQELNRRTLTQEAFDAFAHNGGMMQQSGQFDGLQQDFTNNADLQQVFSEMNQDDFKDNAAFSFPAPLVAPHLRQHRRGRPFTLAIHHVSC